MSIEQSYLDIESRSRFSITWNAILTIAGRDVTRFLREPLRLVFTLVLPIILVGGLAGPLQSNFGKAVTYNLMTFSITGLLAMSLFQSTFNGLMSLIEDRMSDFSQELFIAPISRYAIVFGKILGETIVAMVQGIILIVIGILIFGIPVSTINLLLIIPVSIIICLLGGSMGVLLTSIFSNQRTANTIMPFLLFPQFFLSGVFLPVRNLPWYLDILSKITPMRYAVDLARGVFYMGTPAYSQVILLNPLINLIIIAILFAIFLIAGTFFFVRSERNR
jgi:ABC-2 type transport system permease protein